MARFVTFIASLTVAGTIVFAHGRNEHVRGIVTAVSEQSVSVETADHATKTLTVTAKTTFRRADKVAHLSDLKVGDRVVIDVPEKTTEASRVQIGVAPKAHAK